MEHEIPFREIFLVVLAPHLLYLSVFIVFDLVKVVLDWKRRKWCMCWCVFACTKY